MESKEKLFKTPIEFLSGDTIVLKKEIPSTKLLKVVFSKGIENIPKNLGELLYLMEKNPENISVDANFSTGKENENFLFYLISKFYGRFFLYDCTFPAINVEIPVFELRNSEDYGLDKIRTKNFCVQNYFEKDVIQTKTDDFATLIKEVGEINKIIKLMKKSEKYKYPDIIVSETGFSVTVYEKNKKENSRTVVYENSPEFVIKENKIEKIKTDIEKLEILEKFSLSENFEIIYQDKYIICPTSNGSEYIEIKAINSENQKETKKIAELFIKANPETKLAEKIKKHLEYLEWEKEREEKKEKFQKEVANFEKEFEIPEFNIF